MLSYAKDGDDAEHTHLTAMGEWSTSTRLLLNSSGALRPSSDQSTLLLAAVFLTNSQRDESRAQGLHVLLCPTGHAEGVVGPREIAPDHANPGSRIGRVSGAQPSRSLHEKALYSQARWP